MLVRRTGRGMVIIWMIGLVLAGLPWSRAVAEEYFIAPADTLEISVYGEPDLAREVVVRPDGKVSFPLVGDLPVAGKTTTQVKQEVEEKIRAYVPEASATVIVAKLGSLQYYVIGKVAQPGMFNVSKPLTVLEALAMAGGTTVFAKESRIAIIRRVGDKTQWFPFDLKKIKKGQNLDQNMVLHRGDVVIVP